MIIRSWLFVPGDSERKLEKGRENPADALILDLEDSVPPQDKDAALAFVNEVINTKLECALTPGHKTAFEGETGDAPAHYTQKGEGVHFQDEEQAP